MEARGGGVLSRPLHITEGAWLPMRCSDAELVELRRSGVPHSWLRHTLIFCARLVREQVWRSPRLIGRIWIESAYDRDDHERR